MQATRDGQGSEASPDSDPEGLIPPGEESRKVHTTATESTTDPESPKPEKEDPNDGWGHVAGSASVNGLPLEVGKLHWNDPTSGEQGYSPIEAGVFEFDAPVGGIKVTAWVISHNGFSVPNHETNGKDNLTQVVELNILDAKPNPLAIAWLYEEVHVEGDALTVPSLTPLSETQLYISGVKPVCTVAVTTDAAGHFVATVPDSSGLSVSCFLGGTTTTTPVVKGWTELRIPDAHTIQVLVRDGRNGQPISGYDFFFRTTQPKGAQPGEWKRYRSGGRSTGPPGKRSSVERSHSLSLPMGKIDLLIYAPRQGLAPYHQTGLHVGPQAPRIDVTLQPGGTLALTCDNPPPTGLVNPGYDPDPIMVVDEYMYHWNEPDVQAFGGHVDREGAIPRNLLFTRRLSFNLQGEALVKGLPAGTYRVLHWREGVNWRSEPLEVLAGVTTQVHLTPE
ncbi:MAG: hypothetical protein P1V35_04350 [Planctomycetota bacterium]|nr:hypothetical protein [Planctomycetota bacterium]